VTPSNSAADNRPDEHPPDSGPRVGAPGTSPPEPGVSGIVHLDESSGAGRTATAPSDMPVRGWRAVARRVGRRMQDEHTPLLAAAVAFWAFVSLFPAIIAAFTIFGLVIDPDEIATRLEGFLDAMPDEARELVQTQLEGVAGSSGASLGFGLAVSLAAALWAASTGMGNLIEAVNIVYEEDDDRGFVRRRGLAMVLTIGAIAFIAAALVAITALPALIDETDLGGTARWFARLAVWPILGVGFAIGLAVLYRYAPDRENAEWRWVSWGAGDRGGDLGHRLDRLPGLRGQLRHVPGDLRHPRRGRPAPAVAALDEPGDPGGRPRERRTRGPDRPRHHQWPGRTGRSGRGTGAAVPAPTSWPHRRGA
jgi:uncharacterized BrkB/YihY/UPF0761 family membrane protein